MTKLKGKLTSFLSHKKYNSFVSRNLLSKLSSDPSSKGDKRYLRYNLRVVGVQNCLPLISQFLYMFALTKRSKAFFSRKHPSKKKYRFGYTVGDDAKYGTYIEQYQAAKLLIKLYLKLMKRQLSPEETSVRIDTKYTKVIVWNAPLTKQTNFLETSQNAYLPDMPLYYKFTSKNALSREIAF